MILIDDPYVSEFLKDSIRSHGLPVIKTDVALRHGFIDGPHVIEQHDAIEQVRAQDTPVIYTNSENAIGWIAKHLAFTDLPEKINLFKNKVKFRQLLKPLYPDFFFKEVPFDQLEGLSTQEIPLPCIIKPAVGFFSMGVYRVSDANAWDTVIPAIQSEMQQVEGLYPTEVLDTTSFIIEEVIDGDEFAFDAYFNAQGEPVILNILNHVFPHEADVNDRVYVTSKQIIQDNQAEFTSFLAKVGQLSDVKNFPVHVEIRRSDQGVLQPIEINPLRFGGWCTTADMAYFAYGYNPYVYCLSQKKPDWECLLKNKDDLLYSLIVLNNSTGLDGKDIKAFDYERLLSTFDNPLELRKSDFKKHPHFGFLFAETRTDNTVEIDRILTSDLLEFVTPEL
jgi:hypothetical protein